MRKISAASPSARGARIAGTLLKNFGLRGGGLAEVVLGGWRFTEGVSTGNLKVSIGGGLGAFGGALLIYGSFAAASGWFIPVGAVMAIAGGIAVLLGQRSDLEKALRHGHFGVRPYPWMGSPFDEPEENWLPADTGLSDQPVPLINLREEIGAFRKLFCQVQPQISVHRETRPEFVPAGGRASPSSGHVIIHARINLVGYQTGVSVLNDLRLRIYNKPGFIPGISGKEYGLDAMYVRPLVDGDNGEYLQAVECYLRVPESEARGGFGYVEVQAQMDMNGDGQLLLPDSGVASESVWRWSERGFSNIHWDNIARTTPAPTAQPRDF